MHACKIHVKTGVTSGYQKWLLGPECFQKQSQSINLSGMEGACPKTPYLLCVTVTKPLQIWWLRPCFISALSTVLHHVRQGSNRKSPAITTLLWNDTADLVCQELQKKDAIKGTPIHLQWLSAPLMVISPIQWELSLLFCYIEWADVCTYLCTIAYSHTPTADVHSLDIHWSVIHLSLSAFHGYIIWLLYSFLHDNVMWLLLHCAHYHSWITVYTVFIIALSYTVDLLKWSTANVQEADNVTNTTIASKQCHQCGKLFMGQQATCMHLQFTSHTWFTTHCLSSVHLPTSLPDSLIIHLSNIHPYDHSSLWFC